jgi:hypothetical protein
VAYDRAIYAFWTAAGSGKIQFASYDPGTSAWSAPATVRGSWGTAQSSAQPAVAVSSSTLYAAWKGKSKNDSIWYSQLTSSGWSKQKAAVKNATTRAPAIAPLPGSGGPLAIAWTGSSGKIGYGTLTSKGFHSDGTVPLAGANGPPP